jgi:hypothetical protein
VLEIQDAAIKSKHNSYYNELMNQAKVLAIALALPRHLLLIQHAHLSSPIVLNRKFKRNNSINNLTIDLRHITSISLIQP